MRRRIPTIIALVLVMVLVVGVAISTSLVQRVTTFLTKATASIVPNSIGVANVSEKGFTVYWTTSEATQGSVSYGKTNQLSDGLAVDDRNLTAPNEKYVSHFVRVAALSASTKYFYNISGRTDSPLETTTLAQAPAKPTTDPAFGKITDATGSPLSGAIAVLTITGADKTAGLSKNDGSYVLPASPQATNGQTETITFLFGADSATITCKVGQDRPLPTIKIGDTVDCSKAITITTTATAGGTFQGTTTPSASGGQLIVNVTDQQTFNNPLPTISGKAGPNQQVTIVVHSDENITATVVAGTDGNWTWTPGSQLSAGQHTLTVSVNNTDGTKQTINRTFSIAQTSILPTTSGTPSAQVFHKACVNQACTQVSGAGTDSCSQNSDCVPTPAPVATPAPTTTTTAPPTTGAVEDTLILLGVGLILMGLGLFTKVGI